MAVRRADCAPYRYAPTRQHTRHRTAASILLHSQIRGTVALEETAVEMAEMEVLTVGLAQEEQHRKVRAATACLATPMGSSSCL